MPHLVPTRSSCCLIHPPPSLFCVFAHLWHFSSCLGRSSVVPRRKYKHDLGKVDACVLFGGVGGWFVVHVPSSPSYSCARSALEAGVNSHGSAHLGSDLSTGYREHKESVAMVSKCQSGDGVAGIPLPQQQGGQVLPLVQHVVGPEMLTFPTNGERRDRRPQHRELFPVCPGLLQHPGCTHSPASPQCLSAGLCQPAALAQWVGEARGAW